MWIETEYEDGDPIPLPIYPEEYSGKFNLRIPKSLHRKLAKSATADGVSLNQYVTMLLSRGDAQERLGRRLDALVPPDAAVKQVQRRKAATVRMLA
ncbi:MAG: toxin-antitoxin system HicB family antitoxin [Anaerolineaceae bacterium]